MCIRDSLGVEPVVGVVARASDHGLVTPCADLREPRPGLRLEPPALVVGEVEMEDVEAQQRHRVDHPPHLTDWQEVPREIEHDAAPGQGGEWSARLTHGTRITLPVVLRPSSARWASAASASG